MYKGSGVRSGAWLTDKAETYKSPKGISNYGLVPVTYKNADAHWEKTKKEIGQNFQELQGNAVTASRKTRDYIKRNSKRNPGYPVGLGLGLFGVAAKYSGIEGIEELGDPLICGGLFMTARQIVYSTRRAMERNRGKKKMRIERERLRIEKNREKLQEQLNSDIRKLIDRLERTPVNGDSDRKISYMNEMERWLENMNGEMGPECIEKMRKDQVDPMKENLGKLYGVQ